MGLFGNGKTIFIGLDMNQPVRELNKFAFSAHNAGRATEHFERTTKNLTNSLGVLGGYFGVRQLVEYADTWTLIAARVKVVTQSNEQAAAVQERLYRIAQRTRNTMAATSVLYTRVALNADQLGRSHEELLQVTESVNAAMLISGATGVESAQAMRQFAQALGSGRVQGDEFRTMMEAMPVVARAVADEMGVAVGDLYKLSRDGLIDVQTVIDALIDKHGELTGAVDGMAWTVGQAFEYFQNAVTRTVGIMNTAFGVSEKFSIGLRFLGDNVHRIIGIMVAAAAAGAAFKLTVMGIHGAMWLVVGALKAYELWQKRAAVATALMTSVETIRAWFSLARSIRSASDATALFSLVSGGAIKAAATLVAMIGGYVAYQQVVERIAAETKKWEDNQADLNAALGEARAAPVEPDYTAADMIREARQALALSAEIGDAQKRLQIEYDAVNQRIKARRELTGEALREMEVAIDMEEQLAYRALETENALATAREAMAEYAQIIENFSRDFQRNFANVFNDVLNDGLDEFQDFIDAMRKMFFRLVADLASAELMKSVGDSLANAIGGAVGNSERMAELDRQAKVLRDEARAYHGMGIAGGESGSRPRKVDVELTARGEKSLGQQIAKYTGQALAGLSVGYLAGSMTTNPVAGGLLGGIGGAASGFAMGGPVGALVAGGAGVLGGILGSLKKSKAEQERLRKLAEERNRILGQNNQRLQELRDNFNGRANGALLDSLGNQAIKDRMDYIRGGRQSGRVGLAWRALGSDEQAVLLQVAQSLGITLLNQNGEYISGGLLQLTEAIDLTVRSLTTFGNNISDLEKRQQVYNELFGQAADPLRDSFEILNQAAPELMRMFGLSGININSEIGREALLNGFREIFNFIDNGLLANDPQLLGAFGDKNELLDMILKVTKGLKDFNEQLYDVTTDFPRAMDIVFYEQKFGRYGGTITPPPVTKDPVNSGGLVIQGGVTIQVDNQTTGEGILRKLEQGARDRRSRGGYVELAPSGEDAL